MTLQVVPLLSQGDFLDPKTYQELGWKGAAFAIGALLLVFCVVKGHIKIIGCGPNEGGIREFFGLTLWTVGPGPHLHIAGILPVRKVSFASKQVDLTGSAERNDTVFDYAADINLQVRNDKQSIRLRVYRAEDANRGDAENDEAIRQVGSLLASLIREILERGTDAARVETALKTRWNEIEAQESFESERCTFGYGIRSVDLKKLVEREFSEVAQAIKSSPPPHTGAILASLPSKSA